MKEVAFSTLSVGDNFVFDGKEYVRIKDEKISCCKSLNAALKDNPAQKTQIVPSKTVQINDQL